MSEEKTELERMEVLRLSNLESNRITRECIESALVLLMKEKSFNEISITDVVKRAGVSRTAYYRNYSSKEDILNSMVKEVVNNVTTSMTKFDPMKNLYEFWFEMFHGIKPFSGTFQILIKANMEVTILIQINKIMQEDVPAENVLKQYESFFWSGAVYSVLIEWISNGTKQTVEEMATICCKIMEPIIHSSSTQ